MLAVAAVLIPVACKAIKKHRETTRKPVVVLDMEALAERSLPGRAAAQYIKTVQTILHRGIDDVRTMYRGRENTPEGARAIA